MPGTFPSKLLSFSLSSYPSCSRISILAFTLIAFLFASHCLLFYPLPPLQPSDLSFVAAGHNCDFSRGSWVPTMKPPLYTNDTCRYIHPSQDCIGNGRPDRDYFNWRWRPQHCDLPPFNPKLFLEMVKNKKMVFVGDSISRNHMQSLLCSLAQVEDPRNVFYDGRDKEYIWGFHSYNFTLSNAWSPFLANHTLDQGIYSIHLDMPDVRWTSILNNYDIAIFSTAYWYFRPSIYYLNHEILGANAVSGLNITTVRTLPRMQTVWEAVLRHIVDEYKGIAIVRTVTVPHFEDGEWNNGGACNRTLPESDPLLQMTLPWVSNEMYKIQKEEFMKALQSKKHDRSAPLRMRLLDVTYSSLLRPDGHPGPYRPQKPHEPINDCLHWCLPGPIDMWNELLMEALKPFFHEPP